MYNNIKTANISYMLFKLNFKYYFYISNKKNVNLCSKLKVVIKLAEKLRNFKKTY